MTYDEIWEAVLEKLSEKYSTAIMSLYFKDCKILYINDKLGVVETSNDNLLNALIVQFGNEIEEYMQEITGTKRRLFFESGETKPVDLAKYTSSPSGPIYPEGGKYDEPNYVEPGSAKHGNFYDSRYTFDNFIVGSSNKFAHAACYAVAQEGSAAGYNPLFIYGDSGLGKTHLLYAIINETMKIRPTSKIVYAKGDDFTNEIIWAIRNAKTQEFREKYRPADILLIDDIQFISGKTGTQEEFFHTFNALYEDNKQIVLTSDRPPKDIRDIEDRIRTRFEWGLLADIQAPDYELRIAIMQEKAKAYPIHFPPEIFDLLAQNLKSNIRQMEGAVKKIAAQAMLLGTEPTLELATRCISDMVSGEEPDSVIVEKVITAVSKKYGISEEDIRGKKHNQEIVKARNIAIYIIRSITQLSLPKIGQEFSRNHTTVMNSLSVIEKELKNNPLLELSIDDLIKEIKE